MRYNPFGPYVLKNINFEIRSKEKVRFFYRFARGRLFILLQVF